MNLREADARAKDIAERAALLSPDEGDRLIREETKDFPAGMRSLLLAQSAKYAEVKRMNEQSNQGEMQRFAMKLQKWGFWAGFGSFLIALILVFVFPKITPAQWWVIRVMLCLSGACISAAFSGVINVKGTIGVFAISAAGGFGIFILTFFFNPPSLDPVEKAPVKVQAP